MRTFNFQLSVLILNVLRNFLKREKCKINFDFIMFIPNCIYEVKCS